MSSLKRCFKCLSLNKTYLSHCLKDHHSLEQYPARESREWWVVQIKNWDIPLLIRIFPTLHPLGRATTGTGLGSQNFFQRSWQNFEFLERKLQRCWQHKSTVGICPSWGGEGGEGGRVRMQKIWNVRPIIEHPNFQDQPLKYIFLLCLKKSIYFWLARLRLKKPLKEK